MKVWKQHYLYKSTHDIWLSATQNKLNYKSYLEKETIISVMFHHLILILFIFLILSDATLFVKWAHITLLTHKIWPCWIVTLDVVLQRDSMLYHSLLILDLIKISHWAVKYWCGGHICQFKLAHRKRIDHAAEKRKKNCHSMRLVLWIAKISLAKEAAP